MDKKSTQLLRELQSGAVAPKVKVGAQGGALTAILGAIGTGIASGDWRAALVVAAAMSIPVLVQFGAAWVKVDPRMAMAREVLEEMKRQQ